MNSKSLAILSLLCFLLTSIWIIFIVWITSDAGPMDSFEQVYRYLVRLDWKYYISYLNAAILTLCVTLFFTVLAKFLANRNRLWAFIGFIFVPLYCTINLFVYLSQITIVPHLIKSAGFNAYSPAAFVLMTQFIHLWKDSAVLIFNSVAYTILAIPSIIYGLLLWNAYSKFRIAGIMLTINGLACIIGTIGLLIHNRILESCTVLGGVLFWFAMIPFFINFFTRQHSITT